MKNTKARKREGADLGDVISRAVQAGLNRRKARLGGSKLAGAMAILAACAQAMVGVGDANAGLSALGENHPVNGFPTWVQDSNGVTLQLCLDELNATGGAGICIGTPVEAGNLLSENIGFGPEAFYYMASASLPVSTGSALGYEVAAEAAWGAEIPEEGQQFAFCRLRIRVDQLPVAGIYRLIHPYGVEEFEVTTPGNKAINMTRDIGGFGPDFSAMLYGDLGPFLTAVSPEPPAGYLGDGGLGTLYQVEGSPTGVNYIRLEGPAGSNLDGLGNDFVETDQFSLMGKLFTEAPTPLKVERVTIEEDAARIDVFAKSSPNAELFMTLDGAPIAMDGDSSGGFYGSISVLPGSTIPAVVNIAADDPVNTPVNISVPISDRVQITLAEYNSLTQMLRVDAHSSLEASGANLYVAGLSIPGLSLATASVDARPIVPVTGPEPIRTGVPITGGTLEVMVPLPPSQVLVVSSYGGLDTLETLVTTNPANVEPIASDDNASVDENSSVAINVLGNDVDPDGTLPLDGVQLVAAPVNGTAVV
ncbi:MAG: Ig-like domain-containing protein, partial [Limisphaerales bacterium]